MYMPKGLYPKRLQIGHERPPWSNINSSFHSLHTQHFIIAQAHTRPVLNQGDSAHCPRTRGTLGPSEGIFGYHYLGGRVVLLALVNGVPTTENNLAPNANRAVIQKPWSGPRPQNSRPFFSIRSYSKLPLEGRLGPHRCLNRNK